MSSSSASIVAGYPPRRQKPTRSAPDRVGSDDAGADRLSLSFPIGDQSRATPVIVGGTPPAAVIGC
ncbi:hypothetical protein [Halostagnicola kamekurae]|uniref:hypothetical protein n=1 Tax=Halostagnicola kamekurae TaxID=619731 RepID=UPI001113F127|nr:hypothetical protein [Halostagnicola kamekurae]